jgi:hypothetical protein
MIAAIHYSILEAREWDLFKVEHNCKIVGHMKGETHTGVGYGMTAAARLEPLLPPATRRTGLAGSVMMV